MTFQSWFFMLAFAQTIAHAAPLVTEAPRTRMDTNREVISTYAKVYIEQKDYAKAEALISNYLFVAKDDTDGPLWTQLGMVQMLQRKLPQACHSLQKASGLFQKTEDKIFSNYNFADCLNRGGRTEEAKTVLAKLLRESEGVSNAPEKTLELINAGVIRPGNAFPPYSTRIKGKWRLTGSLGSGYDTNVLLVEDDVAAGIPASNRGSFFVSPAVQVGHVGTLWGQSFDSRYMASFTNYFNSATRSYNSFFQRADFLIGSGQVRWGLYADTYFLNRMTGFSLYDYELGGNWILVKEQTEDRTVTLEVPLQYQYYNHDFVTDENNRTGADAKLRYTRRYLLSDREMFSVQGTLDTQYTTGENYRLVGLDFPVFYMVKVPFIEQFGIVNTFSGDITLNYYYQSSFKRRDFMFRGGAGLLKPLGNGFNLTFDYSTLKNFSNVSAAKYAKGVFTLQVSRDFI